MSTQSISIGLTPDTVQTLVQNGYSLYAFRGVNSSIATACPTLWFRSQTFGMATRIEWANEYAAYLSLQTALPDGGTITASSSYDINSGSTLHVTGSTGIGTVQPSGTPGAIGIANETGEQFTCGISQSSSGGTAPLCAAPLLGWNLNLFQPANTVLLAFEAASRSVGSVTRRLLAPSLLIDMSAAGADSATVTYDISHGWSGDAGATPYPAGTDITALLIRQNQALAAAGALGAQRIQAAAMRATAE